VVAVVLSGVQDCGVAGMVSIKARGGVGVVQSPATAFAPSMPQSVLDRMAIDYAVAPQELPLLLARLAAEPAMARRPSARRAQCRLKYCTARSCRSASSRVLNVPRFLRCPVLGSGLRE
jgi:hypothetical protein